MGTGDHGGSLALLTGVALDGKNSLVVPESGDPQVTMPLRNCWRKKQTLSSHHSGGFSTYMGGRKTEGGRERGKREDSEEREEEDSDKTRSRSYQRP